MSFPTVSTRLVLPGAEAIGDGIDDEIGAVGATGAEIGLLETGAEIGLAGLTSGIRLRFRSLVGAATGEAVGADGRNALAVGAAGRASLLTGRAGCCET